MRIPQTNVVIEYELVEDMLLTIGGNLKEFQKKTNSKVQILNIPQIIPPDAPRIVISTQNALINISLTRFEIISKIPKHIMDNYQSTINFTKNIVLEVFNSIWDTELHYSWAGLVVTIEYSLHSDGNTALELSKSFYDKLININRMNKDLASFQLRVGFKEESFFKNFNISCFETRNISFDPNKIPPWKKVIDVEEYSEITDTGLRLIIDINNKPGNKSESFPTDFEIIINEFVRSFNTLTQDLNIKDLI